MPPRSAISHCCNLQSPREQETSPPSSPEMSAQQQQQQQKPQQQPQQPERIPVAGTWKRLHEEDPLGDVVHADRSTLVLWTQSQTSGLYIDLRLPKDAPGRNRQMAQDAGIRPRPLALAANGLSSVPAAATNNNQNASILASDPYFDLLLQQKSFAGVLHCRWGDRTDGTALKQDAQLQKLVANQEEELHPSPDAVARGSIISLCTCLWNRRMDYQPPTGGLDVGVCVSQQKRNADGSILLRETGSDASYAEKWLCLPRTYKGPFLAMELVAENGVDGVVDGVVDGARHGYWVRTGNKFAYAIGRPVSPEYATALNCVPEAANIEHQVGTSLSNVMQDLTKDNNNRHEMLNVMMSYVCVAGDIRNEDRDWTITSSTNPELVGCLLVGERHNSDALCCSRMQSAYEPGFVVGRQGQTSGEGSNSHDDPILAEQVIGREGTVTVTRLWKVVEQTDCSIPFLDI